MQVVDQVGAEYWQLSRDCAEHVLTVFSQLNYKMHWRARA